MSAESFEHTYASEGTYVVSFEYRSNPYTADPDATARAIVEVRSSGVIISNITTGGAIEITNTGSREADLSGWTIQPATSDPAARIFHIPQGTIILPKKKIVLTDAVTGFALAHGASVWLMLPSGIVSAVYDPSTPKIKKVSQLIKGEKLSANALEALPIQLSAESAKEQRPLLPLLIGFGGVAAGVGIGIFKLRSLKKDSVPTETNPALVQSLDEIRILE